MQRKRFYYAYGVIAAGEPGACRPGLQANLSAVIHDDLALVFSEAADPSLQLTRENALAHNRVITQIMKRQTIIPFSFGTLFNKKSEMIQLLAAGCGEIKATLGQLEGKLELGLKVIWKKEALTNKLERDYADLKAFKEEILRLPPDNAYGAAILLGQRVEIAMKEIQSFYQEQIYAPLQAISLDARLNKPLNERMVINAAFLVSGDQEAEFDARVNELYEQHREQFQFLYSGPWPPYNFINLRLDRHFIDGG